MTEEDILYQFEQQKNKHLTYSIILDLAGMLTYMIPFFGEAADLIYAPFYGIAIYSMYKVRLSKTKALLGGVFGTIEELLPFVDIIPTASLMWLYTYKTRRQKTIQTFTNQFVSDRQTVRDALNPQPKRPSFFKRLTNSIVSIFYEAPQKQHEYVDYTEVPSSNDNIVIEQKQIEKLPSGESNINTNDFV